MERRLLWRFSDGRNTSPLAMRLTAVQRAGAQQNNDCSWTALPRSRQQENCSNRLVRFAPLTLNRFFLRSSNPPDGQRSVSKGSRLRHNVSCMKYTIKVEYAELRKIRERNTTRYRLAHLPIWIWVFFLAPGPWTFDLFAHGGSRNNVLWLLLVMAGTGVAGYFGQLPGVEPRPYILRFTEDKPNPLYRRICYTFAWNAVLTFTLLNLAGLVVAVATGSWRLKQIYAQAYFPLFAAVMVLGLIGVLPRVRSSTQGEGIERRYFYGAVWASVIAQTTLLVLWKVLPKTPATNELKLVAFTLILVAVATASALGMLPRTRPIVPGALMMAD
jgi:hypothetical protein